MWTLYNKSGTNTNHHSNLSFLIEHAMRADHLKMPTYDPNLNVKEQTLIQTLKNIRRKGTPGPNGLLGHLFREEPYFWAKILTPLYSECLLLEDVPYSWRGFLLHPIFKKERQHQPKKLQIDHPFRLWGQSICQYSFVRINKMGHQGGYPSLLSNGCPCVCLHSWQHNCPCLFNHIRQLRKRPGPFLPVLLNILQLLMK